MELSESKINEFTRRLLIARMKILLNHSFFGLLLMHMKFSVDPSIKTACTDGERIIFGSNFLDELTDSELEFVMMHEVMHVVLQHCTRKGKYLHTPFNIAADIVVNSNILAENGMNIASITIGKHGESMHKAPDGSEGYLYSAEEIYHMLVSSDTPDLYNGIYPCENCNDNDSDNSSDSGEKSGTSAPLQGNWDDHSHWDDIENPDEHSEKWAKHIIDAAEAIRIQKYGKSRGKLPLFANRILSELRNPQIDWRTILNEFIHEEIVDYSFSPPDKRFTETPFFLPDFNYPEDIVKNILFMIDTSASMSDSMITGAYSEINGAIEQFDDKLSGWLGFFDGAVIEPKPFADINEFKTIRPKGGGGTNFEIIFDYVDKNMTENQPASIIILTDGYAPFPKQSVANNIPVLWLINNEYITPPWGKIARISEN